MVALVMFVLARPVAAHDVWITMVQEEAGLAKAMINHGHPGDRKPPDLEKLFEFDVIEDGRRGRSLLPVTKPDLQEGAPVLSTVPLVVGGAGVLGFAAQYDNGYWVSTSQGYRNTSKRQVPDGDPSLYSMKYAKALFFTGEAASKDAYGAVLGHRLELVPLSNVFSAKVGETVKVRVLFEGKPLAGAEVESGDGLTITDEKEMPRYRTNQDGLADIPITRAGPYLLVVDHVSPAAHPDLASKDLSNATLSFMILPSR
jgi:uncharacterized GH25 family protein